MARVNFIPLGSIVQLEGGTQKLMVVARGLNVKRGSKTYFFDYGGVQYPQGLTGDQIAYFNHDAIRTLAYIGCNDSDNQIMVETLNAYIEKHEELARCTPEEWVASVNESAGG